MHLVGFYTYCKMMHGAYNIKEKTILQFILISNCQGSDHTGDAEILIGVIFNLISDKGGVRLQIGQDGAYLWALITKLFKLRVPYSG